VTDVHPHGSTEAALPAGAKAAPTENTESVLDSQRFRLVSIAAAHAPTGCVGRDWLVYRISQGANSITGYRRGSLEAVSADVERIIDALNERRRKVKGSGARPGRPAAAVAAARQKNEDAHE
jgi:hypothetical protein